MKMYRCKYHTYCTQYTASNTAHNTTMKHIMNTVTTDVLYEYRGTHPEWCVVESGCVHCSEDCGGTDTSKTDTLSTVERLCLVQR